MANRIVPPTLAEIDAYVAVARRERNAAFDAVGRWLVTAVRRALKRRGGPAQGLREPTRGRPRIA